MGAQLPKPVCATNLERHGSECFRVGVAEMNGWRTAMEDAHVVHLSGTTGYFGILDGHGGAECSEWCAKRLHETLQTIGVPPNDAAAKKMVLDIDQAFLDTSLPSGSTAAMCIVRTPKDGAKCQLHVINAGDSRVLLSRADGTIVNGGGTDGGLTTDHKPNHPSERERIEKNGGTVQEAAGGVHRVNGDLAVSRGFGDANYKKTGGPRLEDRPVTADPEMGHFECDWTDFVMIVCDGVSEGSFPNAEVCRLAARLLQETGGDAAKACEAVCMRAVETGSKDNISCMIVLMGAAESTGPIALGKRCEFHPGSLLGSDNSSFVKAYVAMCERGGVSFAEAAEMRYELLLARSEAGQAEEEDHAELGLIGNPVGTKGSDQRKAWFDEWATKCQERGNSESQADEEGEGNPGDAMEQLAMMKMLLGMMQAQGQGPGAAGGGSRN